MKPQKTTLILASLSRIGSEGHSGVWKDGQLGGSKEFAPRGEFGAPENGDPNKEIEHLNHVHPLSGAFKVLV